MFWFEVVGWKSSSSEITWQVKWSVLKVTVSTPTHQENRHVKFQSFDFNMSSTSSTSLPQSDIDHNIQPATTYHVFRPKLTESFPFNYMLKSKLSLSRHFEYANKQITYHFWLCSVLAGRCSRLYCNTSISSGNIVEESIFDKYFAEKLKVPTII
jgi:hypothetical protein